MAITKQRLKWLNKNKAYGEVSEVVVKINQENPSLKPLTLDVAYKILRGKFFGNWGKIFSDALEKSIRERQEALEEEKKMYSNLKV